MFLYWANDQHWAPITFILEKKIVLSTWNMDYTGSHSYQEDYLPHGDITIRNGRYDALMLLIYLNFSKHC